MTIVEETARREASETLEKLINDLKKAKELVETGKAGIGKVPYEDIKFSIDTFGLIEGITGINIKPSVVIIKRD